MQEGSRHRPTAMQGVSQTDPLPTLDFARKSSIIVSEFSRSEKSGLGRVDLAEAFRATLFFSALRLRHSIPANRSSGSKEAN